MADAADAETETTHAFISYANQDRIIAEEVERQLTELAGKGKGRPFLKCFLDTKSIPPGQRYQPIIKSALEQADWLIVIFTGHQSVYSGYEIGLYSILHSDRPHEERPIICLHDVERSRLPAVLDGCNTTLVSQVVPNDPRDSSPSGEEVNLWFESPVGRLLRAICDSKELYTANDNPMQYTIDIARAAKKICSSFAPARGHSSEAHVETPPQAQPQVISFLYATNRRPSSDESYFSGERADDITYGAASVQIPDSHRIGKIELPFKLSLFSLTLYEESLDPQRHFIIKSVDNLSIQDWTRLISSSGKKSSLVFVHGSTPIIAMPFTAQDRFFGTYNIKAFRFFFHGLREEPFRTTSTTEIALWTLATRSFKCCGDSEQRAQAELIFWLTVWATWLCWIHSLVIDMTTIRWELQRY